MKTLIINDLHLGVQRSGGTTLSSATALREWAHQRHRELLQLAVTHGCQRVIVNGDLTDVYGIPLGDAIDIFVAAREFLDGDPMRELIWAEGNHDLSKDSTKLGTVGFLGRLLAAMYQSSFTLIEQPTRLKGLVYVIPHLANQELFDEALAAVPEGTKHLLLHCNFDNTFAGRQDHSLNISRAQAKELTRRGIVVILGHEHQGVDMMGGKVVITGNQFPTSISDCLAHDDRQKDGEKHCLLLDGDTLTRIPVWNKDQDGDGWFAEVDWRELKDVTEEGRGFIRVTGDADAADAADKIKAIAEFRQRSKSFVVTDAVKVQKHDGMDALPDSIEDLKGVDVIALLLEMLSPEQANAVRELLGEKVEETA